MRGIHREWSWVGFRFLSLFALTQKNAVGFDHCFGSESECVGCTTGSRSEAV